jgi:anti-sigma B factor antagonist
MACSAWSAADPQAESVAIEVTISANTATVVLSGELDLLSRQFLFEQFARLAAEKPGRLVFDVTRVGFMDCDAARQIVGMRQLLPDAQRPVIRHPAPAIRRVLQLTGLADYCTLEGLDEHLGA